MAIGAVEMLLLLGIIVVLPLVVGLVVLLIALGAVSRRSRRCEEEHQARVTQEMERIRSLEAAGRISATESAELVQALEDRRTEAGAEIPTRRLYKSASPLLAGVCGGLAEWLGWDTTLVRVGYVLATLLIAGFPGVLVYLILALVMPRHPEAPPARLGRILLLLVLLVLLPLALVFGLGSCLFLVRSAPTMHRVQPAPVSAPVLTPEAP